jgi:hypothetical protein
LIDGKVQYKDVPLVVTYTGSPLAITAMGLNHLTISHRPSGFRLPVIHTDQGELTQLLHELATLGWPTEPTTDPSTLDPALVSLANAIIGDWCDYFGSEPA